MLKESTSNLYFIFTDEGGFVKHSKFIFYIIEQAKNEISPMFYWTMEPITVGSLQARKNI